MINNIRSVSKYESKLLVRSWFFKIFTILILLIVCIFNVAIFWGEGNVQWSIKSIASNIPYLNLLILNLGQAIIAIFLSSDFLKRDKKLDTSEVFYVRPLSNAEYVLGKIWGNLRVFLFLNLVVMAISLIFSFAGNSMIDWGSYLIYFFIISVPTLIYIIGLSVFLMLLLKNQALTFILLLGYVGLTIFYISDKFYYLFDYMAFYLPMVKSTIVGFSNMDAILTHRGVYLFAGIAFICITISLFNRLPNTSRSHYPWVIAGSLLLVFSGVFGYRHIHSIVEKSDIRELYTTINNRYVHTPKMIVEQYDISFVQNSKTFSSVVTMEAKAIEKSSVFTFCLNPGLQIEEICEGDKPITFRCDHQIILVDFNREIETGEQVSLSFSYKGSIDKSFCYLDIPKEVLEKEYRFILFSSDKQYSFQTESYLLLTPETYWYPRPGTAYSSESPDWQQSYFSQFRLNVTPLPGLTPLSQGEGVVQEDSSSLFTPEYPVQAITLAVGKYKQQSVVAADSIQYSIWHIEGHDYYSDSLIEIQDTIPTLIQNFKEGLERTYRFEYPFPRLSLIEVPAQFYSYQHAWTEAQEVIQPEMILFKEKGWTYEQFDIEKRIEKQKQWAKRRRQEISDEEAKILTFNDVLNFFATQQVNGSYTSAGRGEMNFTSEANPYFVFPLLYNFRYNIYSSEWPIGSRIVELYLNNTSGDNNWERRINGISNDEKANLLMEKQPLRELLSDIDQRNLMSNVLRMKASCLFAPAEKAIGITEFRDSLYTFLEQKTFQNIQFEQMIEELEQISESDIHSNIETWNAPMSLPYYTIEQPDVVKYSNRGQEIFVLTVTITNNSAYDGFIQLDIVEGGGVPPTIRKVFIPAQKTMQLVSLWENEPREVNINTLISGNFPNIVRQKIGNIRQERGRPLSQEGDFVLEEGVAEQWDVVIVDNEDSTLFSLSQSANVGLLPKWLDRVEDTPFKYKGVPPWRPPYEWTLTTNAGYYGKYIRSAYVIKSGNGNQTATWKIPVPSEGTYELYYHVFKDDDVRHNRGGGKGEYTFYIDYNDETEDAFLNIRNAKEGWEQLGVYYIASDTITVTLTNECQWRSVTADAVKIEKRQ